MKSLTSFVLFIQIFSFTTLFAQETDLVTSLQAAFNQFNSGVQNANLYLNLNDSRYAPGDTVFFNCHFLNSVRKPLPGRHILHIAIKTSEGNLLLKRFIIQDGVGHGEFVLSDDIPPGVYRVVAYTPEMIAVEPPFFYETTLVIAGEKLFENKDLKISIHPEGGSLIGGVLNKLVIRTSQAHLPGKIVDETGKTLIAFSTDKDGIASVKLSPVAGEKYYCVVKDRKQEFPPALDDGVALEVEAGGGKSLNVSLRLPENSKLSDKNLMFIIHDGVNIRFSTAVGFSQGNHQVISVDASSIGDGVLRLALMVSLAEVLAERSIFLTPSERINASIDCDKNEYSTRETAVGKVAIRDAAGILQGSRFSVLVYKDGVSGMDASGNTNLFEDIRLRQYIDDPVDAENFFQRSQQAQNDFMVTQTTKKLRWENILKRKEVTKQKAGNFFFRGHVVHTDTGTPVPGPVFITFYLNNSDVIYGTSVDKDGTFEFPLFDTFKDEEVFYGLEKNGQPLNKAKIILEEKQLAISISPFVESETTDKYFSYTKTVSQIHHSYQYYSATQKRTSDEDVSDIESDFEVDLRKFENFKTMADVITNIVTMVKYNRKDNDEGVRVFLKKTAGYANANPVFIIDGVMTDNVSYFFALNPSKVSRIKVLREEATLARYGVLGKNGILVAETLMPDTRDNLPRTGRTFFVTGITMPSKNVRSDCPKQPETVPDLRSTLYWNPIASTNTSPFDFQFCTSDITGNFCVMMEGLTATGEPFAVTKRILVTYNP
jgi:hypothetical protein